MAPPKPPPLTARERDILRLLAQGRENSAIAVELVISPSTVKTHVAHLLDKLGLDNRVQAAVFAVRHGIVLVPPRLEVQRVRHLRAPVALPGDVDLVVLAVGPDPPGAPEPAPESELALLGELCSKTSAPSSTR